MKKFLMLELIIVAFFVSACEKDTDNGVEEPPSVDPVYIIEEIKYKLRPGQEGSVIENQYRNIINFKNLSGTTFTGAYSEEIILCETSRFFDEDGTFLYVDLSENDTSYIPIPDHIDNEGEIILTQNNWHFTTTEQERHPSENKIFSNEYTVPPQTYLYEYATIEVETLVIDFEALLVDTITGEKSTIRGQWIGHKSRFISLDREVYPITDDFDSSAIINWPSYTF